MIETNFIDTEIGCVPADWKVVSLGEIGEVRMCKRVMKYQTSEKGEIPFFKIGTFGKTPDTYISRELYSSYKEKYNYPKKGDILLSAAGTIGRTVVFDGKPSYFQDSNIVWIENDEKKVYNELLFYIYKNLSWVTESGTIPRIYNGIVRSIVFAIPSSLPEQRRIASALSSIDNLISALDKLIEKKNAIKTGAMQELLGGKRRVKGCEGEWKSVSIDEICDRLDNLRIPISEVNRKHGTTPYYGANGIQGYVEGFTHNGEYILLAEDGANSLVDYPIRYVSGKIWVNNHAHVLQAKEMRADNKFLSYAFKNVDFESNIVGCGRTKLNSHTLMQLKIVIPSSLSEQRAIASVLTAMDDELTALEAKKAKCVVLKQGMMQQLLTGKIRLVDSPAK